MSAHPTWNDMWCGGGWCSIGMATDGWLLLAVAGGQLGSWLRLVAMTPRVVLVMLRWSWWMVPV